MGAGARASRHTSTDGADEVCVLSTDSNNNPNEGAGKGIGINLDGVRKYARQLFSALRLLEQLDIVHADLKPDNILVNEALTTLKICDLG